MQFKYSMSLTLVVKNIQVASVRQVSGRESSANAVSYHHYPLLRLIALEVCLLSPSVKLIFPFL